MYSGLLCLLVFLQLGLISAAKPEKISSSNERRLADAAVKIGDFKTAKKHYKRLLSVAPTKGNYYKRATMHMMTHKYPNAVRDLSEAIKIDPKYFSAYAYRGEARMKSGYCEEAIPDFEKALELKPGHKKSTQKLPEARTCAVRVAQAKKSYEAQGCAAINAINGALEVAPYATKFLLARSECHFETGDYQSCVIDTGAMLKLDPHNLDVLLLRGRAQYFMGEMDAAIKHYKMGLKFDPDHKPTKKAFKALKKLIRFEANGDEEIQRRSTYQDALDSFTAALEIDPSHPGNMARLYIKQCNAFVKLKKAKEAIAACTSGLNLKDDQALGFAYRGEAYLIQEDFEAAVREYNKAFELDRGNSFIQEGHQRAHRELKISKQKNYYKILGVPRDANQRQIKKAYRKLALQHHPDKVSEEDKEKSEKLFHDINEAHEVLSDDEMRAKYDRGEDVFKNQGGGPPPGHNPFQHFVFRHGGNPFG